MRASRFVPARENPMTEPTTPPEPIPLDRRLAPAVNGFGLRLLADLADRMSDQNLFISPASIAIALAMTGLGARGETQRAIHATLGLGALTPTEIAAAFSALHALRSRLGAGAELALANAIFGAPWEHFEPDFIQECRAAFAAEVRTLDFTQAGPAAAEINAWIAQQTAGLITDLVQPAHLVAAILVLVNAIYFKGIWTDQFDPALTRDGDFHAPTGVKRLPMMSRSGHLRAYQDARLQAVSLPYGDGRTEMLIILPARGVPFHDFYRGLDAAALTDLTARLHPVEGSLVLPRFRAETAASLKETLRALGMAVAFSGNADFSGMARIPPPIAISEVLHKAVMEVNEEGTVAAAATAVIMVRTMAVERFSMVVDRPFFCAIRDGATGLALFMGAILDPQSLP
jgi:serpin B